MASIGWTFIYNLCISWKQSNISLNALHVPHLTIRYAITNTTGLVLTLSFPRRVYLSQSPAVCTFCRGIPQRNSPCASWKPCSISREKGDTHFPCFVVVMRKISFVWCVSVYSKAHQKQLDPELRVIDWTGDLVFKKSVCTDYAQILPKGQWRRLIIFSFLHYLP